MELVGEVKELIRETAKELKGHGRGRNQPPAMAFSGKMVCGYPIYSPYRPG